MCVCVAHLLQGSDGRPGLEVGLQPPQVVVIRVQLPRVPAEELRRYEAPVHGAGSVHQARHL